MKTILVGVDGSPESRKAADFAAQIASATASGLEFAHVLPEIASTLPSANHGARNGQEERTDRAHVMLFEMSQSVPSPLTAVDTSLLEGGVAHRLAKEAKRPDIWLVVVGHRGRGAVERVLIGSTADRLTQICPKPVIVVR